MILYLILTAFNTLRDGAISLLPTLSTPVWAYSHIPDILTTILGFNNYLPIVEVIGLVLSIISITLSWKIGKIILGLFNIDLNK